MRHIERDDEVTVYFTGTANSFKGRVCYMPSAPGECWIIEDDNGALHYVQTFAEIVKYKETE